MPEKYLVVTQRAGPGLIGHLFWFIVAVKTAVLSERILILPRFRPKPGHNSGIPTQKQLHNYLSLEKTQVRVGGQPQPFSFVRPGDLDRKEKMKWTVACAPSLNFPNRASSADLLIHTDDLAETSLMPKPPPCHYATTQNGRMMRRPKERPAKNMTNTRGRRGEKMRRPKERPAKNMTNTRGRRGEKMRRPKERSVKNIRKRTHVKLFPRQEYWQLAQETAQALGGAGNYYALHVRRGDRIRRAAVRGVDCDKTTQPQAIIERIRELVPQGATLYLMSDEPDKHFFDPLKRHWQLARHWDFPQLDRLVNQPNPLLVDNHALFLVEGLIYCQAKLNIATYRKHRIKIFEQFFRFASPKALKRNEHYLFEHYPAS